MNRPLRRAWKRASGPRMSNRRQPRWNSRSGYLLGGIGIPLTTLVLAIALIPGALKLVSGPFAHTSVEDQPTMASQAGSAVFPAVAIENELSRSDSEMTPVGDIALGLSTSDTTVTPATQAETGPHSSATDTTAVAGNERPAASSDSNATMVADTNPTSSSSDAGATPGAEAENNPPLMQYLADPAGIEGGIWVEVSLTKQTMVIYKGKTAIFRSRVSTGQPGFESPTGIFYVQRMLEFDDMDGEFLGEDYFYRNVPNVMYFTERGHALHGVYWHDDFGTPLSHGCVGMPPEAAAYLFSMASIGMGMEIFY